MGQADYGDVWLLTFLGGLRVKPVATKDVALEEPESDVKSQFKPKATVDGNFETVHGENDSITSYNSENDGDEEEDNEDGLDDEGAVLGKVMHAQIFGGGGLEDTYTDAVLGVWSQLLLRRTVSIIDMMQ